MFWWGGDGFFKVPYDCTGVFEVNEELAGVKGRQNSTGVVVTPQWKRAPPPYENSSAVGKSLQSFVSKSIYCFPLLGSQQWVEMIFPTICESDSCSLLTCMVPFDIRRM